MNCFFPFSSPAYVHVVCLCHFAFIKVHVDCLIYVMVFFCAMYEELLWLHIFAKHWYHHLQLPESAVEHVHDVNFTASAAASSILLQRHSICCHFQYIVYSFYFMIDLHASKKRKTAEAVFCLDSKSGNRC